MFDLPSFPLAASVSEGPQMAVVQQVQQTYGVTVCIRPHQHVHMYRAARVVIVRGSVGDSKAVKEATAVLFEQLTGSVGVWCMMLQNRQLKQRHTEHLEV